MAAAARRFRLPMVRTVRGCAVGLARALRTGGLTSIAMTDGNLGAHLRRLEDDGYVARRRAFVERKPFTWYRLTASGRKALDRHLRALREVIAVAPL